eukprot:m.39044 g.39044  ORF g.39044 m.39044 type:complete len:107 (+) comp10260_c0_seq1:1479-1799(+)
MASIEIKKTKRNGNNLKQQRRWTTWWTTTISKNKEQTKKQTKQQVVRNTAQLLCLVVLVVVVVGCFHDTCNNLGHIAIYCKSTDNVTDQNIYYMSYLFLKSINGWL